MAHGRVQRGRGAHLLQRVAGGGQLGMGGQQPAQLLLQRVVLRVGHQRLAAVVRVAQLDEAGGERLDPLLGVRARAHGPKRYAALPTACASEMVPGNSPAAERSPAPHNFRRRG